MRVEARDYYARRRAEPDVAAKVGALARERIGGLQGLAAEPPQAARHGARPSLGPACADLRPVPRPQPDLRWVTPDAPSWPAWPATCPSGGLPVVRLAGRHEVCGRRLARSPTLLGLQTRPRRRDYDTLIIGGGPAGLAAAVYGASEGLRTVVVEREAPGGQAGTSSRIENYLGLPRRRLRRRARRAAPSQQARRLGAEILVTRTVSASIRRRAPSPSTAARSATRTVILATGVTWRRLAIDGFERLIGKGIYYGAARSEAAATHGQDVHLIGAGNSAGQAALFFANHARRSRSSCAATRSEEHVAIPDRADRGRNRTSTSLQCEVRRRPRRRCT